MNSRGVATKAKLVKSARAVFERDGFVDSRITNIAQEAGVAHGTFYTYFDSKEEIFEAVIIEVYEDFRRPSDRVAISPQANPVSLILLANQRFLATFAVHARLIMVWENVAANNDTMHNHLIEFRTPFIDRTKASIERLQSAGLADPDIDPRYAAIAINNMVRGFALTMFGTPSHGLEVDAAATTLTRLWANSIGIARDLVNDALKHA